MIRIIDFIIAILECIMISLLLDPYLSWGSS